MIDLQITFYQAEGKYKPISTIVKIENIEYYKSHKAEVQKKALLNIAHSRKTTPSDLVQQGYTRLRTREYNIDKINKEEELRYKINLIKYYQKKRKQQKEKNE